MKDLEAAYILGIKIYGDRSCGHLGLSQSTCLDEVLKGFSMQDSKGIHVDESRIDPVQETVSQDTC